jgi:hypothetical protein
MKDLLSYFYIHGYHIIRILGRDRRFSLVSEFETGALPHARWTHREDLTVAFWYLSRLDEAEATDRIRAGIVFLNHCHGTPNTDTRGYHENVERDFGFA